MLNEAKPWRENTQFPRSIYAIEGEIKPNERHLDYWLARDAYQGLGAIVEVGALVGPSTTT